MEMFDDVEQLLQQPVLLETMEPAMVTDYCVTGVKEEDDREKAGHNRAEPLQAEMVPTYAPQEPREEEAFEEDQGESSSSGGQHQSWCHMSTSGNNLLKLQAFSDVPFDSQTNGDNAIVFADWKKEMQMEETMIRTTGSKIEERKSVTSFDYRRRQAAFCERWSASQTRSSHRHNDPYHLATERRSKGRYCGQFSSHINAEEKYQRNVRHVLNPIKHYEVTCGRRMGGTFLLEKSPSYFNDHHKMPYDSYFNKKKSRKSFKLGLRF